MRSSDAFVAALLALLACASRAEAQQQPQGFAVERLYLSAPGAGWFVMDALDMRGGLGGATGLTIGYAHDPLQVRSSDGSQHVSVVSDQAIANFGFAATYDRFRAYFDFGMPLVIHGQSGTAGAYSFTAPGVDPGSNPDTLSDPRIGIDARVLGEANGPLRLGAGAQLYFPSGQRSDYDTDGTYRAMGRLLVAGDIGMLTYAAHVGAHVRPLDDSPAPASPQGSELLFGVAGGARLPMRAAAFIVGPEIYGATAFRSLFDSNATALEALLSGRVEGTGESGPQLRLKLGTGGGINPRFGAPEWRAVLAIELFDRRATPRKTREP